LGRWNKMKSLSENCKSLSGKKPIIIAIDGPAASGKSTTARLLAKRLGYLYLDTGAMYRALTWKVLKEGVDMRDKKSLAKLAKEIKIRLQSNDEMGSRVFLNGEEITFSIRSPQVNKYVSLVSMVKEVREEMVRRQREMGRKGGIVAEGRDIGTVVFPKALVKIFLTCSLEERVRRRWKEARERNSFLTKKEIKEELSRRDKLDREREFSPLRKAKDAIVLDNTFLSINETTERVLKIVKNSLQSINL